MRFAMAGTTTGLADLRLPPALHLIALLSMAALLTAAGCSKATDKKAGLAADGGSGDAAVADGDGAAPEGVDRDTTITVDDGRVEVCSPAGWTRGPQSKDYLVKYTPSRKKTFPSIVVTAAAAPEGIGEVDAGGQSDFVAAIAASLADTYSKNGKSTLLKKPAGVRLGPHFGATWAAPATIKIDGVKESIDRTSFAVIVGGRMYTVEVRAPKGKLDGEGRAAARAVASAIAPPVPKEEPVEAEPAATEEVPAAETASEPAN